MKPLPCLLLSCVLVCPVLAQDRAQPAVGELGEDAHKKAKSLNRQYLVYLPKEAKNKALPLLIYLHGSGGVGNQVRRLGGQVGPIWRGVQQHAKERCILVAPQCLKRGREGGGWLPADLNVLLLHLKSTYRIDASRVYLTGNSMGGYGSWAWGGEHPEHFAAIAPVSGGIGPGGPKDVTPRFERWVRNLAKVPVFAFAGAKDRVVPAERSQRVIAAIRKAGGKRARIKVYPDEGHNARRLVYTTAELYDWMFSQKRIGDE